MNLPIWKDETADPVAGPKYRERVELAKRVLGATTDMAARVTVAIDVLDGFFDPALDTRSSR